MQCHCAVPRIHGCSSQSPLGWALPCFPALDCECTQGSPSRHSSVPLAPGPQRGHSSLCPHIALFGFLSAVSALGPHCSVPGGSSNSCCCPWDFQSLHLQLSGVFIHGLGGPVGQWVWPGDHQESAHPPLTCARNSGGTQQLLPVQVVAGPLHRLDVEIKAALCENAVLVLFLAPSGLETCPLPRARVLAHVLFLC